MAEQISISQVLDILNELLRVIKDFNNAYNEYNDLLNRRVYAPNLDVTTVSITVSFGDRIKAKCPFFTTDGYAVYDCEVYEINVTQDGIDFKFYLSPGPTTTYYQNYYTIYFKPRLTDVRTIVQGLLFIAMNPHVVKAFKDRLLNKVNEFEQALETIERIYELASILQK